MKGAEIPSGMIRWFGRNLRASGLGVFSVWMKIVRAPLGTPLKSVFEARGLATGRAVDERFGSRDAVDRPRDTLGAAVRGSARRATSRSVCPLEAIFNSDTGLQRNIVLREDKGKRKESSVRC